MAQNKRKAAAKKVAAKRAAFAAITTFYEVAGERNDKMAMVELIKMVKEVIKYYRILFDDVVREYENQKATLQELDDNGDESYDEQKIDGIFRTADDRVKAFLHTFVAFGDEWLNPFMNAFEEELSLIANVDDRTIDAHRRAQLHARQIEIPSLLYTLSKTYGLLSFGLSFFSGEYAQPGCRRWEPNSFGSVEVWQESDRNQFRMFLSDTEPYQSLQVFRRPNYVTHRLPYYLGGGKEVTPENRKKLTAMQQWLKRWEEKKEEMQNSRKRTNENEEPKYLPPRKKKYTEGTYKLNADTFYMKCPGCDYIVVFPRPLPSFINRCIKRKDASNTSVWLMGEKGAHKLDLANVKFDSEFKKKHAYKVMQGHVAKCEECPIQPDCFGKPRQQQLQEQTV
jgi:hypothetical protein